MRNIFIFLLLILVATFSFSASVCSIPRELKLELEPFEQVVEDGEYFCYDFDVMFDDTFKFLDSTLESVYPTVQGSVAGAAAYQTIGKPAGAAVLSGVSNIGDATQQGIRRVSEFLRVKNFFASGLTSSQLLTLNQGLDMVANPATRQVGIQMLNEVGLIVDDAGRIIIRDPSLRFGSATIGNIDNSASTKKLVQAYTRSESVRALKTSAQIFSRTSSIYDDLVRYSASVPSSGVAGVPPESAKLGRSMVQKLDNLADSGRAFKSGMSVSRDVMPAGSNLKAYILRNGDDVFRMTFNNNGVLVDAFGNPLRGTQLTQTAQRMGSFTNAARPGVWARLTASPAAKTAGKLLRGGLVVTTVARGSLKAGAVGLIARDRDYIAPQISIMRTDDRLGFRYGIHPNIQFTTERIRSSASLLEEAIDDNRIGNAIWEISGFLDFTQIGWSALEIVDHFQDKDNKYLSGARLIMYSNADQDAILGELDEFLVAEGNPFANTYQPIRVYLPDGAYVLKLYVRIDGVSDVVVSNDVRMPDYLANKDIINNSVNLKNYLDRHGFYSNTLLLEVGDAELNRIQPLEEQKGGQTLLLIKFRFGNSYESIEEYLSSIYGNSVDESFIKRNSVLLDSSQNNISGFSIEEVTDTELTISVPRGELGVGDEVILRIRLIIGISKQFRIRILDSRVVDEV